MATLADLFASTQAPNPNQLMAKPVAYQRGGSKLGKAVGTVGDILAAIGGRAPVYEGTMQARENAYNQSMKEQQFQNVFRNFVENPNDPMVQANLAYENPDAFLKVAPQNKILPQGGVARMGPFGTPEMVLEAPVKPVAAPKPTGFEALVAARSRYPEGSPERALIEAKIAKDTYIAPQRAGGSGGGGASPGYRVLAEEELPANLQGTGQVYQINPKGQITRVNTGKAADKPGAIGSSAQLTILDEGIADLRRAEELLMGGNVTGPVIGAQPEWMQNFTSSDTVTAQEAVARVAQKELRAILGGQFAQKEGEALIKRAFNPSQSEAENLKRVRSLIRQVQARRDELAGKVAAPSAGGAPTATDAQGRKVMWNGTAWVPAR